MALNGCKKNYKALLLWGIASIWASSVTISGEKINTPEAIERVKPTKKNTQKKISEPVQIPSSHKAMQVPSDAITIDRIEAKVFGPESTDLILMSDLMKPDLSGAQRNLEEMIFTRLVFQDAKKFRIIPSEEEIDRDIANVQKQHNISLDELKEVFKASGYTYQEGRDQLSIMRTVDSLLNAKIRGRLVVADKDIQAYYNANPEMQEASYQIAKAFFPLTMQKTEQALQRDLVDVVNKNSDMVVDWQEPFWLSESQIAEDKKFIIRMQPGEIIGPFGAEGGFELIKLMAKRGEQLKPFDERYREIADLLRKPKFEELLANYKKSLFENAAVIYY